MTTLCTSVYTSFTSKLLRIVTSLIKPTTQIIYIHVAHTCVYVYEYVYVFNHYLLDVKSLIALRQKTQIGSTKLMFLVNNFPTTRHFIQSLTSLKFFYSLLIIIKSETILLWLF